MGYHVDNVILSFHYYLLTTMSNNETIALELLENLEEILLLLVYVEDSNFRPHIIVLTPKVYSADNRVSCRSILLRSIHGFKTM